MSIPKSAVEAVIREAVDEQVLKPENIPVIDLYMDQVLSLFESVTGGGSAGMTKAMINNYSKDKLLTPVKGKKYTREQLVRMLLIYYMKPVLQIQSIKTVLSALEGTDDMMKLYSGFLEERAGQAEKIPSAAGELMPEGEELTDEEAAMLIMALCSLAGQLKQAAERLVEDCLSNRESEGKKK